MGRFRIEGDYYIIPENYDYALAKYMGKSKQGVDVYDFISFHNSIHQALNAYYKLNVRKTVMEAPDGTIHDLLDLLVKEQRKTHQTLLLLMNDIENFNVSAVDGRSDAEENDSQKE